MREEGVFMTLIAV